MTLSLSSSSRTCGHAVRQAAKQTNTQTTRSLYDVTAELTQAQIDKAATKSPSDRWIDAQSTLNEEVAVLVLRQRTDVRLQCMQDGSLALGRASLELLLQGDTCILASAAECTLNERL